MRVFLFFLFSCFFSATLFAQSPKRLTGIARYIYNSGSFDKVDSTSILYNAGNTATGGADEYNDKELKMDEEYQLLKSGGSGLKLHTKYEYEYNANMDIVKRTAYQHFGVQGWIPDDQTVYTYTAAGSIEQQLTLAWNVLMQQWDSSNRIRYQYDANNNLLVDEVQAYHNNVWTGVVRSTNTYDAGGKLILSILENGNGSSYDTAHRITYSYTAGGLMDVVTHEIYDVQTASWANASKRMYTYDANGMQVMFDTQVWSAANSAWTNQMRVEFHYNSQSELTYTDVFNWQQQQAAWEIDYRDTIVNAGGAPQTVQHIQKRISSTSGSLINSTMQEMTYNSNQHMTLHISRSWNDVQNSWDFRQSDDSTVYYYAFPTGVNEIAGNAPDVSIYPNPASNYINVSIANSDKPTILAVYDMSGRLMMQQQVPAGREKVQLPLQQLSAGQYMLSVKGESGKSGMPFVVR